MILRPLLAVLLSGLCLSAQAAAVFEPHISEYGNLPRGDYLDTTLVYTSIGKIWNDHGHREPLGFTAIPPGSTIDASLLLVRYLWVGNVFEDTRVPFFPSHDQFLRIIGTAGHEQGSGAIPDLSRVFGQTSNATGIGDLFLVGGFYGEKYHVGPLRGNGLYAATLKAPIGEYDHNSLLNIGTHYWTVIPQIGHHQEWFGKLILDATAAFQWNGSNGSPSYGGLTPSKPASVYNLEGNAAYKVTEHFYVDAGFSFFKSVGSNHFDDVTLNIRNQPVPATTACASLMIPTAQCSLTQAFYLAPIPGNYRDRGISDSLATFGLNYIYRASTVISLRAALPVAGRGSKFDVPYYVCASQPCNGMTEVPGARQTAHLDGVQEAAAISASPFYELRVVFLLFAP